MEHHHPIRFTVLAALMAVLAFWTLSSSAAERRQEYPNARLLVTGEWLKTHAKDPNLLVVDVRDDKDVLGRVIPDSLHLSWKKFRAHDTARAIADVFVGTDEAQRVLGAHGVSREATVVLYDSLKEDGGAVASYVFWIFEVLGHKDVRILERGVDGWADAGGAVAATHRKAAPVLYQAVSDELQLHRWVTGPFLQSRLGDPHYMILDVRSRAEYLGEETTKDLAGRELKRGHVPTALNVFYKLNWTSTDTKAFKSYDELRELYRGLDPMKTVVTYCTSGRRGSFGYFTLRLMGFENVALYASSWNEWGNPAQFFPVETHENKPPSGGLPATGRKAEAVRGAEPGKTKGGYVSCGG